MELAGLKDPTGRGVLLSGNIEEMLMSCHFFQKQEGCQK